MTITDTLNQIKDNYKDNQQKEELNKFLDSLEVEYTAENIISLDENWQLQFLVRFIKKYTSKKISGCALASKIISDFIQDDVQLFLFKIYTFGFKEKIIQLEQNNQELLSENNNLKEALEQFEIDF